MSEGYLGQFEALCRELYEGNDRERREEAQQFILNLESQPDALQNSKFVFQNSQLGYAQFIAAQTLTTVVSKPLSSLGIAEKLDLRSWALQTLFNISSLEPFVISEVCKLCARITKLCWFEVNDQEQHPFRTVIEDAMRFISAGGGRLSRGLQLLNFHVSEMNRPDNIQGLAKHRKVASSFREENLLSVFQIGLNVLDSIVCKTVSSDDPMMLLGWVLQLCKSCLGYDFIGACTDETADDLKTVQVPTTWKETITSNNLLSLFFELYLNLEAPLSSHALNCLVQLASVRRTIFSSSEDRLYYLEQLVDGLCRILKSEHGLKDGGASTLTVFPFTSSIDIAGKIENDVSGLHLSFKYLYMLSELVCLSKYRECLELIARFTLISLENWDLSANSVHYLLGLWERLVSGIPYLKSDKEHFLTEYTPQVFTAYWKSRLLAGEMVVLQNAENHLNDQPTLVEQLKQVSTIARAQYETSCHHVHSEFQNCATSYLQAIQQGSMGTTTRVVEEQLAWMVYIIAAIIGARSNIVLQEEQDEFDAQLIAVVLQFIQSIESTRQTCNIIGEDLDLAVIYFLQELRANYVGEQRQKSAKVQQILNEQLNINGEMELLNLIIQKVMSNLRWSTESEEVIRSTLSLLSDFCTPFNSVRKLVRLESVQFLLSNHTSECFPFLDCMNDTRLRTTYYNVDHFPNALGKIINHDFTAEDQRFEMFMSPLASISDALAQRLMSNDPNVVHNEEVKRAVLGLARDLRGLVSACAAKASFMLMFDWIYPDRTMLFIKAVEFWHGDPAIAVPILKFMFLRLLSNTFVDGSHILDVSDTSVLTTSFFSFLLVSLVMQWPAVNALVTNSRMSFGASSPNGILLFRETSKMIVTYGERILAYPLPSRDDIYRHRYKGLIACYDTLKMALGGDYVNFGVFKLYNDPCLDEALDFFFRSIVTIPLDDIMEFPKLSRAFFSVFVFISRDHSTFLGQLDASVFRLLMICLRNGVKSVVSTLSINACTALDSLLSFVYSNVNRNKPVPEAENLAQLLSSVSDVLLEILRDMFHILMFENCKNQWSMSRPLLPLILFNPQHLSQIRDETIANTSPRKQQLVSQSFGDLLEDIEESLLVRNRDKFTQKISVFRRNLTTNSSQSRANSIS
eukprot:gene3947-6410_t